MVLRAEKEYIERGLQNPNERHPEKGKLFLKTQCYRYTYAYYHKILLLLLHYCLQSCTVSCEVSGMSV